MSVYGSDEIDKIVAIDHCHQYLVTALVSARKPRNILELGFGAGASCRAILQGLNFNSCDFSFKLVDCWLDFNGVPPDEIRKSEYDSVSFVTSGEFEYVHSCQEKYDFIFSDADHINTQNWFEYVYNNLLNEEGILVYHDVTNSDMFPNLLNIYKCCIKLNLHHMLFNYSSRADEKCGRGLLVIFKH